MSSFAFITPVTSSMVAPALQAIKDDFKVQSEVLSQLTLSIFVLAFALGPLVLGPLSEIYGRVIVLQLANLIFLVFNIACGVARTEVQMIIFRFLAGLGGSAPLAVSQVTGLDLAPGGRSIDRLTMYYLLGWRRGPLGLLRSRTTREEHCNLQPCTFTRTLDRSHRRWLYRRANHLALGLLLDIDRRRRSPSNRALLSTRDIRPQDPPHAGQETAPGDRQRGVPDRRRTTR